MEDENGADEEEEEDDEDEDEEDEEGEDDAESGVLVKEKLEIDDDHDDNDDKTGVPNQEEKIEPSESTENNTADEIKSDIKVNNSDKENTVEDMNNVQKSRSSSTTKREINGAESSPTNGNTELNGHDEVKQQADEKRPSEDQTEVTTSNNERQKRSYWATESTSDDQEMVIAKRLRARAATGVNFRERVFSLSSLNKSCETTPKSAEPKVADECIVLD